MSKDCKHCHGEHSPELHARRKMQHQGGNKCGACEYAERSGHLAWAKQRALAYLPGNPSEAVASMISDLGKHQAWQDGTMSMIFGLGAMLAEQQPHKVREWVEGFN